MTHIGAFHRACDREFSAAAVLVVEDDWLLADELAASLRASGYGIIGPAANATAAMAMLNAGGVDAAFLDVTLRGETSFAVAIELAARRIPFLFMTGHNPERLPPAFRETPVLQKPLTGASLRQAAASPHT